MQQVKNRDAIYYVDEIGNEPCKEWINELKDRKGTAKILSRINRAKDENFGNHRVNIQDGVSELKIDFGPGYRVYYGIDDNDTVILLLGAGTKSKQQDDINTAVSRWNKHKERKDV